MSTPMKPEVKDAMIRAASKVLALNNETDGAIVITVTQQEIEPDHCEHTVDVVRSNVSPSETIMMFEALAEAIVHDLGNAHDIPRTRLLGDLFMGPLAVLMAAVQKYAGIKP